MGWEGRRQIFGFVDAVSEPRSPARLDLSLDAVDAPAFEAGKAHGRDYEHLCMVRVMSTAARLAQLFDVGGFLEGQWFWLDLEPAPLCYEHAHIEAKAEGRPGAFQRS